MRKGENMRPDKERVKERPKKMRNQSQAFHLKAVAYSLEYIVNPVLRIILFLRDLTELEWQLVSL